MPVSAPAPSQDQADQALRAFLLAVLPDGTEVVRGQINRVPEPDGSDFAVFWLLRRERLQTNIHDLADCVFTGSLADVAGTAVLTVSLMQTGVVRIGATLFGAGILPGTLVTGFKTGSGGVGTYLVSQLQTLSSRQIAAGGQGYMQAVDLVYQVDVHGPRSADNAQAITTLFRDEFAVQQFADTGFDVAPLHADDPRQMPFTNAEQQVEDRWVVEAHLQANQSVIYQQEFADALSVTIVEVDEAYPPSP